MIQASKISRRNLLALAWPIFVEQVLHLLLGVVGTFMVSHISDDAVAALAAANQIVILFILVFSFVGMGASVVVTHHLGGGDREGADHIAVTAIGVNTLLGLLVSVVVYLCAEPMLRMMQLSDKLLIYAVPFLADGRHALPQVDESRHLGGVADTPYDAMIVTAVQNVLNFAGNAILLFGLFSFPKMGVVGVAIATVFSRFVACIALWVLLEYRTRIKLNMRDLFRPSRERLARILHIGLPAAGENISWWLAFITVTAFTARMGDQALATQSYTMQLVSIVVLCSVAIGLATEIIIGHLWCRSVCRGLCGTDARARRFRDLGMCRDHRRTGHARAARPVHPGSGDHRYRGIADAHRHRTGARASVQHRHQQWLAGGR